MMFFDFLYSNEKHDTSDTAIGSFFFFFSCFLAKGVVSAEGVTFLAWYKENKSTWSFFAIFPFLFCFLKCFSILVSTGGSCLILHFSFPFPFTFFYFFTLYRLFFLGKSSFSPFLFFSFFLFCTDWEITKDRF